MDLVLVKTFGALVVVFGLMGLIAYCMKKVLKLNIGGRSDLVEIKVLGSRMLQPKRSLYVIQVLNKIMVVSSTEQGLAPVGEIHDPEILATLEAREVEQKEERHASHRSFTQHLRYAESLGDFFHKPFNVILWRSEGSGLRRGARARSDARP